jgi:hypothetical protein
MQAVRGALSWSRLSQLSKCGQAYRYRYIDRVPEVWGLAPLVGRVVHRAVESDLRAKMDAGALLAPDAVRAEVEDAAKAELSTSEWKIDGVYEGMTASDARARATNDAHLMALTHHELLAPRMNPTGIELRVEIPASEALPVPFIGVIDVLDGEMIRDTKTTAKAPSADVATSSEQLTAYELLYRALRRIPSAGLALDYLWVTPAKREPKTATLTTTRNEHDLAVFVARANAAVRVIDSERFLPAPTDSWICSRRFCSFVDVCPYFAGRERPQS